MERVDVRHATPVQQWARMLLSDLLQEGVLLGVADAPTFVVGNVGSGKTTLFSDLAWRSELGSRGKLGTYGARTKDVSDSGEYKIPPPHLCAGLLEQERRGDW